MRCLPITLALAALAGCAPGSADRPAASNANPSLSAHSREAPAPAPADIQAVWAAARAPGARAVVVNVWASWCMPCREEFPDLVRLRRDYAARGLRLVLVSADFEDQAGPARRFLTAQGVEFPTLIKSGNDQEFIAGFDPAWSGALPATLVLDGQGRKRAFIEGRTDYARLESAILPLLDPGGRSTDGGPS